MFTKLGLLVTGHGLQGVNFIMEFPDVLPHIVLYSISSAIGIRSILLLLIVFRTKFYLYHYQPIWLISLQFNHNDTQVLHYFGFCCDFWTDVD
jgi:hypothetical protein